MGFSKLQVLIVAALVFAGVSTFCVFHSRNTLVQNQEITLDYLEDIYYYSKASYCDSSIIENWKCGLECEYHSKMSSVKVYFDKAKEAQGYCGYNTETSSIVVAFRGTNNFKNWLSDFNAVPVDFEDCAKCKIHQGFRNVLNAIQDGILSCVSELIQEHPKASFVITGHSLGGALATLEATKLKKLYPNQPSFQLVTFGSPRVGNTEFSNYVNSLVGADSFRVVNYHDIVPHVPLKTLMGFLHVGTEIWLNDRSSPLAYEICNSTTGENPSCSSSVMAILYSAGDHTNYFGFYSGCGLKSINEQGEDQEEWVKELINEQTPQ